MKTTQEAFYRVQQDKAKVGDLLNPSEAESISEIAEAVWFYAGLSSSGSTQCIIPREAAK